MTYKQSAVEGSIHLVHMLATYMYIKMLRLLHADVVLSSKAELCEKYGGGTKAIDDGLKGLQNVGYKLVQLVY